MFLNMLLSLSCNTSVDTCEQSKIYSTDFKKRILSSCIGKNVICGLGAVQELNTRGGGGGV